MSLEKNNRLKEINQRATNKEISLKQMGNDFSFYYPNNIIYVFTVLCTRKIFDAIKCTQYLTMNRTYIRTFTYRCLYSPLYRGPPMALGPQS